MWVESRRWFIQYKQFRLHGKHTSQCQTLALAPGQMQGNTVFVNLPVEPSKEPYRSCLEFQTEGNESGAVRMQFLLVHLN